MNAITSIKKHQVISPCQQLIIYSINTNDLIEEMYKIIVLLLIDIPEDEIRKHNINKSLIAKNIFTIDEFEAYDFIINDRKYTVKKYNFHEISDFPSGISTSYLNINNEFQSIGFLGFTQSTYRHYFLSVEEFLETYIRTSNFEYFKSNKDQIMYFILDFLHVLDQLKHHRIKLMNISILFAVVKSQKRWRFRVNDIGQFCYVKKPNLFENHIFLITVLESLLLIDINKDEFDFIRDLAFEANMLRNEEYDYYIEILILKVEKKLNIH